MKNPLIAAAAVVLSLTAATNAHAQAWNAQPQAQPGGPELQAGGLTPPPPMPEPPPTQDPVAQQLDQAKQEDAGRGLSWVWIDVEGGFQHVGLQTFSASDDFLAGMAQSSSSGGVIGAGIGARLLFLTLGARGRVGMFSAWKLFSLGGELGLHFPIGNVEPRLTLGAGYAALGSIDGLVMGSADAISVHGLDARVGAGVDYYVTPVFSVGAGASWEFLALTRPGLAPAAVAAAEGGATPNQARRAALAADGSGYGQAIAVTAALGLHF